MNKTYKKAHNNNDNQKTHMLENQKGVFEISEVKSPYKSGSV